MQNNQKKILGLDLGLHATGYYCETEQGRFVPKGSSTPKGPKSNVEECRDRGLKVNDFLKQVSRIITENDITDVCYELIDLEHAPKGNHSEASTAKLNGLGMALEGLCAALNVRCYTIFPNEWKRHLFGWYGKGYEKKPQIWNKVCNMGYKPKTQDEADAIGIWYYGKNNVERLNYAKR